MTELKTPYLDKRFEILISLKEINGFLNDSDKEALEEYQSIKEALKRLEKSQKLQQEMLDTLTETQAENERLKGLLKTQEKQSEQLNCQHEWKVEAFDCYGMPYEQYCEHCGKKEAI